MMNMWLKRKKEQESEHPEKLSYSRYYEHDGALRAYANRAMVLAFLCVPATLLALGFAVYVRVQPPTVIRVDENGQAGIVGPQKPSLSITQGVAVEPSEFEKRAFVRQFLERYLNFSPSNVSRNWADSLNMMTANLRRAAFGGMQKENLVGKIQDDQSSSEFQLRSLEAAKDDPLTYTAFGVKESRSYVRSTRSIWTRIKTGATTTACTPLTPTLSTRCSQPSAVPCSCTKLE